MTEVSEALTVLRVVICDAGQGAVSDWLYACVVRDSPSRSDVQYVVSRAPAYTHAVCSAFFAAMHRSRMGPASIISSALDARVTAGPSVATAAKTPSRTMRSTRPSLHTFLVRDLPIISGPPSS